ncbi:MAG TPA: SMR family transporter [Baekduia sp.]|nr:SMR family transporter [Baekduia sp.]
MTWALLALAIAIEVAATSLLKLAGQGRVAAIVAVVVGYAVSFAIVARIVQRLEIGTVYAIWSGVGTAAVAIIGVAAYGDAVTLPRVAGITLIIVGVVALNLTAPS